MSFNPMLTDYWLSQCTEDKKPMPACERHIYILEQHVVKKRMRPGEAIFPGYNVGPEFETLERRDENEILAMELIKEYTDIVVPDLVARGDGYNVFTRIEGVTINHPRIWARVTPRQRESLRLQVQSIIRKLWKIPNPNPGTVRSAIHSGEMFRRQLLNSGPFCSTQEFIDVHSDDDALEIANVDPLSIPVFSHMDWELSNIIVTPNMDAVAGVIDWEHTCWFPEAGKSIHNLGLHQEGWERLFDGLETTFPTLDGIL